MIQQGHTASIVTIALEAHHDAAPEVSFVHIFPGAVKSGIAGGEIGALVHIPLVEAGDRHVFLCSARFPAGPEDVTAGVPLVDGLAVARGTDGQSGSGVYSIDANGESGGPKVEKLLARLRGQGMVERVRENIESDINGALASGKGS